MAKDQLDPISTLDLLLEASRDCRYRDPSQMVYLAELAQAAAERLSTEAYGPERVGDIQARVWAELGNAYRLADLLDQAETAFERALDSAERGSGEVTVLSLIADRFATLLCHRRRFPEALALLDRLAALHLSLGDRHLAGRALITRGLYTENAGDPAAAFSYIAQGLDLIDATRDASLVLAAIHNLFWCAADLGHYSAVAELLPRARALYGTDRLNLLRLEWLEGRLAAGLGDPLSAERHFQAVRAGFAEVKLPFPVGMVSLDLALLWAREGRYAEVVPLAEEMLTSFQALRIDREFIVSLVLLRLSCKEEDQAAATLVVERILAAKTLLEELERRPR